MLDSIITNENSLNKCDSQESESIHSIGENNLVDENIDLVNLANTHCHSDGTNLINIGDMAPLNLADQSELNIFDDKTMNDRLPQTETVVHSMRHLNSTDSIDSLQSKQFTMTRENLTTRLEHDKKLREHPADAQCYSITDYTVISDWESLTQKLENLFKSYSGAKIIEKISFRPGKDPLEVFIIEKVPRIPLISGIDYFSVDGANDTVGLLGRMLGIDSFVFLRCGPINCLSLPTARLVLSSLYQASCSVSDLTTNKLLPWNTILVECGDGSCDILGLQTFLTDDENMNSSCQDTKQKVTKQYTQSLVSIYLRCSWWRIQEELLSKFSQTKISDLKTSSCTIVGTTISSNNPLFKPFTEFFYNTKEQSPLISKALNNNWGLMRGTKVVISLVTIEPRVNDYTLQSFLNNAVLPEPFHAPIWMFSLTVKHESNYACLMASSLSNLDSLLLELMGLDTSSICTLSSSTPANTIIQHATTEGCRSLLETYFENDQPALPLALWLVINLSNSLKGAHLYSFIFHDFSRIWKCLLDLVQWHWETLIPINLATNDFPSLNFKTTSTQDSSHETDFIKHTIDHKKSLLYQKLQMINYCINKKLCTATNNLEPSPTALTLIENPTIAVLAPVVQSTGPITSDMILVTSDESFSSTKNLPGESKKGTQEWNQLKSDMEAFKDANPSATFSDFIRWHSPKDWIAEEKTCSKRMSEHGNSWVSLWNDCHPCSVRDQQLLFDFEKSAIDTIRWLEELTISAAIRCTLEECLSVAHFIVTGKQNLDDKSNTTAIELIEREERKFALTRWCEKILGMSTNHLPLQFLTQNSPVLISEDLHRKTIKRLFSGTATSSCVRELLIRQSSLSKNIFLRMHCGTLLDDPVNIDLAISELPT